ncbi:MAG TPA: hypothetical protein VFV27_11895 [Nevskiaceae bacterium]|nr:hypothetical protein [Nevskiaceae bacterium]
MDAPRPDAAQIELDQALQALKDEAISLHAEGLDVEEAVLYPPESRVTLYFGVAVSALLVESVTFRIDDGAPQTVPLDERQAKALLRDQSLMRLARVNVSPGAHRVSAEFRGRFADAKADSPPVSARYEAIFDKALAPAELELRVTRRSRRAEPQLDLREWRPAR